MCSQQTDTYIQLLGDRRRRRLIQHIRAEDTASLGDLADQLASASDDREEVAVELHHNHLPKLATAGIVEYDDRSNAVRYSPPDGFQEVAETLLEEPIRSDR